MNKGLAKTRLSVQYLHWNVLFSLINRVGLNAVGFSPFSVNPILEKVSSALGERIEELWRRNCEVIPVVHGDAILVPNSTKKGGTTIRILGGDKLVSIIARHFVNREYNVRAIFITDVDGVYTSDPKLNESAKLIPIIKVSNNDDSIHIEDLEEEFLVAGESTHKHDVTGGLKAKVNEAIQVSRLGVEVTIVKCGSVCAENAMKGESFVNGTIIKI